MNLTHNDLDAILRDLHFTLLRVSTKPRCSEFGRGIDESCRIYPDTGHVFFSRHHTHYDFTLAPEPEVCGCEYCQGTFSPPPEPNHGDQNSGTLNPRNERH